MTKKQATPMAVAPAAAAPPRRPPTVQEIATALVNVTGGTQMRTCLNDDVVQDYIDRMAAGDEFPPVIVFQEGIKYWLADGFHRFRARRSTYAATILAEVHVGTMSDAIAYAVGANKTNGLRRTIADKQMAVRAALAHEGLRELSDHRIAALVGVHQTMVSRMRNGEPTPVMHSISSPQQPAMTQVRRGADGKSRRLPRNPKAAPAATTKRAPTPIRASRRAAVRADDEVVCPHCQGTGYINGEPT